MSAHKYPVGLSLSFHAEPWDDAVPVSIKEHLTPDDGQTLYMVENQLDGEILLVAERTLVPRGADYAHLAQAYKLVALSLAAESAQAEQSLQFEEALKLMDASTTCYTKSVELLAAASVILKRRQA